jgi:F-type H+-transporting ATPase subunit gamma
VANLKIIRKRIGSVKSTQKITRAMKMVAGARLNRAQQRISAIRPYAVTTGRVLQELLAAPGAEEATHPLLARREKKRVLFVVITSDRGLCGSFNASINKRAELEWKKAINDGVEVQFALIGRKGRDYFRSRKAPTHHVFEGLWDGLGVESARSVARTILKPFVTGEVDALYLIYNEFKSAMTQRVVVEPLFPVSIASLSGVAPAGGAAAGGAAADVAEGSASEPAEGGLDNEFLFEPSRGELLNSLVPMYVQITILRALYESMASELGARMTAMDAATKNASEMISKLTLIYNRARQATITTEILEIIGGAEALQAG